MAKRSTGAGEQVLEARKQAPLLVFELPVHAALLVAAGTTSTLAIERLLLAGIDAPGNPAQQHQHFDLALQIVRKDEFVRRDGSQAVHTRSVTRCTESRPQTETA